MEAMQDIKKPETDPFLWSDYFGYIINYQNPKVADNIIRQAEKCNDLFRKLEAAEATK